ncbi:IPT/TIG domain-containing protein [Streptomyces sp. 8N616]|uniref:IPT/TIG domain-containing protein n=1 Tax=Streptomyces sp. 8N616 TaxID=3457414 RepID=UPI003FD4430C
MSAMQQKPSAQGQLGFPFPPIPGFPPLFGPTLLGVAPSQGGAGDIVLLVGFNLNNPVSVTFGGVPATGVTPVLPGILLSAVVPAGVTPGLVDAQVITSSGASNTFPFLYTTITLPPPPVAATIAPASGPTTGGTAFTITGSDLTGATVTIGGVAATSINVDASGTVLTGVTPLGVAGNQTVVVTTPGGTTSVAGGFTYTAPAAPIVSSIVPTTGPVAGGTAFIINGTNLTGATVTVGGNPAPVLTIDPGGTQLVATLPPGAVGPASVVVTTAGGTVTVPAGITYV